MRLICIGILISAQLATTYRYVHGYIGLEILVAWSFFNALGIIYESQHYR